MTKDYRELIQPLLDWYPDHHRDLPWRNTTDPYCIWVSEIMLQQTRVEAVKPYYHNFLEQLPDIKSLASCPEDQLMKLWEGLGYYSRVRNMQKAARILVDEYEGRMPADYDKILSLPGIGAYTAGAISSIAFQLPHAAVDGNVLRILTRAREDARVTDEDKTRDCIRTDLEDALREMKTENYGMFNQAMMELGATVCLPKGEARCDECPWNKDCEARKHHTIDQYPVRKKKKARRIEEKTVLLIRDGSRVLIEKRPKKGLLAGLYQFPNLEGQAGEKEIVSYLRELGLDPLRMTEIGQAKHIFSHVEWHMQGYEVRVSDLTGFDIPSEKSKCLLADIEQVSLEIAIPSAFRFYAEQLGLEIGMKNRP